MASPLQGFEVVSRRRFLLWGAGLGSLVLMGGGLLRGLGSPPPGLGSLSQREYQTAAALADTLFPRGGAFPPGAADFDLALTFDAFLADEPAENRRDLRLGLFLVEYGPLLFDGTLATFTGLSPEARAAHWRGWEGSGLSMRRQLVLAFRKFFGLVFFDRPEVWPHVGYDGPWEV